LHKSCFCKSAAACTPWWNVTPSGDHVADQETGRAYASAFLSLMKYNAAPVALGWIVSDMARAGRYAKAFPGRGANAKKHRGIDAVAGGFMMAIGHSLQTALAHVAAAAVVLQSPDETLRAEFLASINRGDALQTKYTEPKFEPVYDLIRAHKKASAAHSAALAEQGRLEKTGANAGDVTAISEQPCHDEFAAFDALLLANATTAPGLVALAWMFNDRPEAATNLLKGVAASVLNVFATPS
jgi:hypothetical protein